MEARHDPKLTLAPSIAHALAELDEGLQRDYGVSVALAAADGSVVYRGRNGVRLPDGVFARDTVSQLANRTDRKTIGFRNGDNAVIVPLVDGRRVLGALIGYRANGHPARDRRLNVSSVLSPVAAMIVESATRNLEVENLTDELARRYEELSFVYELGSNMELGRAIEFSLDKTFKAAVARLGIDVLIPFRPLAKRRRMYYASKIRQALTREHRAALYELESRARAMVLKSGEPWVMNDLSDDEQFAHVRGICAHVLSVPVKVSEEETGVITVMRRFEKERFFMGDVKLISALGKQAAIIMRNTRLFREIRSLFLNLVKSLISIVEAKHKYTRGHSERVNKISCTLAKYLGLRSHTREVLHWASLFHDVGKISVPDAILNKTDALTESEFDLIKQHPVVGYKVLSHIEQLREALPGIRHHHEKMDGSGYPDGLKGDEIPLVAKIIAVADVYDALTSSRSYRPAIPTEEALEIMRQGEGKYFDPRVLKVFLQKHDEIIQLLHAPNEALVAVHV